MLQARAEKLVKQYPGRFELEAYVEAAEAVANSLRTLGDNFSGSREDLQVLRGMINAFINDFLRNLLVVEHPSPQNPVVQLNSIDWHQVEILKMFTRHFVINRPGLSSIQMGQGKLLKELVTLVKRWLDEEVEQPDRLPTKLYGYYADARELKVSDQRARHRAVIDYISGLTDLQTVELHRVLCGGQVDLAGTLVQ